MANTINIPQEHKEMILRAALSLTPEQMCLITAEEIREYNDTLEGVHNPPPDTKEVVE